MKKSIFIALLSILICSSDKSFAQVSADQNIQYISTTVTNLEQDNNDLKAQISELNGKIDNINTSLNRMTSLQLQIQHQIETLQASIGAFK